MRYLLLRLALGLAVVWGAASLSFFLGLAAEGDPALRIVQLEEGRSLDSATYHSLYTQAAVRLGLQLPSFYFSIAPNYYPDTLHSVLPLSARRDLEDRLRSDGSLGAGGWTRHIPRLRWHGTHNRYHVYLKALVTGSWGLSLRTGESVLALLIEATRRTLLLTLPALLLAAVLAIPMALYAARSRKAWVPMIGYVVRSIPGFLWALVAVLYLTGAAGPFPSPGWPSASASMVETLPYLLLPVAVLTIPTTFSLALLLRASLLRSDLQPPRRFGLSLGLSESYVWRRWLLPLGLVPSFVTAIGLAMPGLLSGAIIVEFLFNIPGLGRLLLGALMGSDWPVVTGVVLLAAMLTASAFTGIDLVIATIDPRRRHA